MYKFITRMKKRISYALIGIAFLPYAPSLGVADTIVDSGWELYTTINPITVAGAPFVGSPLGTFTFDALHVNTPVGTADTIVQRLTPAVGTLVTAGVATIQIAALQLVSVGTPNFGAGAAVHFVVLSGAPQVTGTETITFTNPTGGIFDSSLPISFSIRKDDPNTGLVVASGNFTNTVDDMSWGELAPTGAFKIEDINFLLKGDKTDDQDFWAGSAPQVAAVPEPALAMTTCLSIAGMALMSLRRRFSRKKDEVAAAVPGEAVQA